MEKSNDTEVRILEAATAEFHEKGYHGARMQEIARRAELNQSLLHYYYRSKDRLFEAVFRRSVPLVMEPVLAILVGDAPLLDKVEVFVETYIDQVRANPHLPGFIVDELRRNPERLREFVGAQNRGVFQVVSLQIGEAVDAGTIRPIAPEQFIANLLALCAFPFVARPLVQTLVGMSDDAYDRFLQDRKTDVVRFFTQALAP